MHHAPSTSLLRRHARPLIALGATLAAIAAAGIGSTAAQAAVIATSACDNALLTQPFASWGDRSSYKLVPGGDFESGLGAWSATGGARVVAGSEPFAATGKVGGSSLYLPAGASVLSPLTCVNAAYPTFRFFARDNSPLAVVAVSVVYRTSLGVTASVPVGVVALTGSWQPSAAMLTASAIPGALNGGAAQLALRFTAIGGSAQIDDIYVDPRLC
jgi:hypothetical protein